MKKTIWKYELEIKEEQTLQIPIDFEILTVQVQKGKPCLWVLVDPSRDKIGCLLETFGTGVEIGDGVYEDRSYIGTYQVHSGELVFHVFEYTGI